MARLDDLLQNYARLVAIPLERKLAGPQRVCVADYDKSDERRSRARVAEFELSTKQADHTWVLHDFSDAFARWMAGRKYRDSYFENPDLIESALVDFKATVVKELQAVLTLASVDQDTVVAVQGIACLFGFLRVSEI